MTTTKTEETPQQQLVAKVVAAAQESGYVQKDANHGQGYKYADDEAITTKFREALLKQGLIMFPEQVEVGDLRTFGEEGKTPNVLVTIHGFFTLSDGSASLRVSSLGQGLDRGDKAIYKAMTGFKKYAYRHLVMMATGDDPEKGSAEEPATSTETASSTSSANAGSSATPAEPLANKEQQDELKKLAAENNLTKDEMSALRKAHTDKARSSQFTVADYEAMKAAIVETGKVKEAAGEGAEVIA